MVLLLLRPRDDRLDRVARRRGAGHGALAVLAGRRHAPTSSSTAPTRRLYDFKGALAQIERHGAPGRRRALRARLPRRPRATTAARRSRPSRWTRASRSRDAPARPPGVPAGSASWTSASTPTRPAKGITAIQRQGHRQADRPLQEAPGEGVGVPMRPTTTDHRASTRPTRSAAAWDGRPGRRAALRVRLLALAGRAAGGLVLRLAAEARPHRHRRSSTGC